MPSAKAVGRSPVPFGFGFGRAGGGEYVDGSSADACAWCRWEGGLGVRRRSLPFIEGHLTSNHRSQVSELWWFFGDLHVASGDLLEGHDIEDSSI